MPLCARRDILCCRYLRWTCGVGLLHSKTESFLCIMGSRARFVLLILVICHTYADARSLETLDVVDRPMDSNKERSNSKCSVRSVRNQNLCTMCEEFMAQALSYLDENKTQMEIINALHKTCSWLYSFKPQCISLVDYYAPLFFLDVATIQPKQFCEEVNLCEGLLSVHLPKLNDACTLCHHVIDEVLTKLKDPDTELEIIEILLKGCNRMKDHVQECKKFVLEYGPLILVNAEKFLEKTDVCAVIYGCKASQELLLDQKLLTDG